MLFLMFMKMEEELLHYNTDVTSIKDEEFFDCGRFTSITLPNSVTSIGNGAFYFCI